MHVRMRNGAYYSLNVYLLLNNLLPVLKCTTDDEF